MYFSAQTGGFYSPEIHADYFIEEIQTDEATGETIDRWMAPDPAGPIADAVEITPVQYAEMLAGQEQGKRIAADGEGYPVLLDSPAPTLAEVKSRALATIDATAGAARARYITVAAGQEATYLMKGQHARDYAAAGYSGTVPLLIAAEQAAAGDANAQAAADRIIAEESAWVAKAAQIEQERRTRKIAVAAAPDVPSVDAITAAAKAALDAM